jgi:hypothetical protein
MAMLRPPERDPPHIRDGSLKPFYRGITCIGGYRPAKPAPPYGLLSGWRGKQSVKNVANREAAIAA